MSRKNWRIRASKEARIAARNAKAERKPFTAAAGIECSIQGEPGEGKKLGTFAGNAYTGASMTPGGWWGVLIVDLAGVRIPDQQRPVLRQHDHQQIVGHTETVTIKAEGEDKGIHIAGVFSGEPHHTAKVTTPAKNGFKWQLSIGAEPIVTEFLEAGEELEVNGEVHHGPATISRVTELGEISFVPLGADGNTSATVAASKGARQMNAKAMLKLAASKFSDEEIDKMSDDEAKAELKKCMAEDTKTEAADEDDEDSEVDEESEEETPKAKAKAKKNNAASIRAAAAQGVEQEMKAARSAAAAEVRRQNEIHARVMKFAAANPGQRFTVEANGKTEDLIAHAIEHNWTPDKVELHALRQARPNSGGGSGPHIHVPGAPILNEAVFEAAVFDALPDFKLFDKDFYEDNGDGRRRVPLQKQRRITAELNARYTDEVRQAAHTHFRGRLGLQQMLTMLAAGNGYRGSPTFNDPGGWGEVAAYLSGHIRADGPSSVNTPATLANVQNKFLLQGYMYTDQAYLDICHELPVKDLKPTKSVQLFGDFQFQPLNTSGEIQHASVGDNPYANQADLQARMVTLPLTYILDRKSVV